MCVAVDMDERASQDWSEWMCVVGHQGWWYRSGLAPLCLSLLLVEREGAVGLLGGRFLGGGGEALYGEFGDGWLAVSLCLSWVSRREATPAGRKLSDAL